MNTFVPYITFEKSAAALDNSRLNKQVAECGQILRQLDQYPRGGWAHHPAIRMWVGYDEALWLYTCACEAERLKRSMNPHAEMEKFPEYDELTFESEVELPPWWGGPIHQSHQLVLAAKHAGVPRENYKHLYYWPV
jgi:hypothetical protein